MLHQCKSRLILYIKKIIENEATHFIYAICAMLKSVHIPQIINNNL